jgi:hypothetical protein
MEQSPSWEADSQPASQEIPCLLWNLKILYHVHKSLRLVLNRSLEEVEKHVSQLLNIHGINDILQTETYIRTYEALVPEPRF